MLTKSIPYTFNRDGYYYFTRRVPKDLAHHYSRLRIVECLRTTSARQAKMQAQQANAKLEAYWASLRVVHASIPGSVSCLTLMENLVSRLKLGVIIINLT